jgi:hypothetical protein
MNSQLADLLEELSRTMALIAPPDKTDPYLRELVSMVLEKMSQLERDSSSRVATLDKLIYILSDLRFELTPFHEAYSSITSLMEIMTDLKAN